MNLIKYGFSTDPNMDNVEELQYENEYAIEKTTGNDRLIVSTKNGYINLMLELLKEDTNCQYFILYVLHVSRCNNKLGRYQIPDPITWDKLNIFCAKYSNYFETDGRHHFWIMNYDTNDFIVYDNHNVLYVYGNIESKIKILENKMYKKVEKIRFMKPHTHHYNKENDHFENEIIHSNEWIVSSLVEEHDDY